jgi:hypothetical protein
MTGPSLSFAAWRKSSHSGSSDNCVEVASPTRHVVAIRDSKSPHGLGLGLSPLQWRAFLDRVKDGVYGG